MTASTGIPQAVPALGDEMAADADDGDAGHYSRTYILTEGPGGL